MKQLLTEQNGRRKRKPGDSRIPDRKKRTGISFADTDVRYFTDVSDRFGALAYTQAHIGSEPIQMLRPLTFYEYLATPTGKNYYGTNQGPHTIPYLYYEFLTKHYALDKIFKYLIPKPEQIRAIITKEEVVFDSQWAEEQILRTKYYEITSDELNNEKMIGRRIFQID